MVWIFPSSKKNFTKGFYICPLELSMVISLTQVASFWLISFAARGEGGSLTSKETVQKSGIWHYILLSFRTSVIFQDPDGLKKLLYLVLNKRSCLLRRFFHQYFLFFAPNFAMKFYCSEFLSDVFRKTILSLIIDYILRGKKD